MILGKASLARPPGRRRAGLKLLAAALGAVAFASGTASAGIVYSFENITNNNAVNATTGESQLAVDVNAVGSTQVSFTFTNSGPLPSSITRIYFDDGALLAGLSSITEGPGTDYQFANPQPGN